MAVISQSFDFLVLSSSFASFSLFLVVHTLILRRIPQCPVNLVIFFTFAFWLFVLLIFLGGTSFFSSTFSRKEIVSGIIGAGAIYVLLVFHYLSWVFGMGEAAIRIRLLRELDSKPSKSATLKQILQRYSAKEILRIRLERLTGSGHLSFDGSYYCIRDRVLLLPVCVSNTTKRILGVPVSK